MKKHNTNFTLIELLVIMAIIGILCSILIPSLKQSRIKAYSSVSKSQLKQIGTALMMYTSQNDAKLPPPNRIKQNEDGSLTSNRVLFPTVLKMLNATWEDQLLVYPGVTNRKDLISIYTGTEVFMGNTGVGGGFRKNLSRRFDTIKNPSETIMVTQGKAPQTGPRQCRGITGYFTFRQNFNIANPQNSVGVAYPYLDSQDVLHPDNSVSTEHFRNRTNITFELWSGTE